MDGEEPHAKYSVVLVILRTGKRKLVRLHSLDIPISSLRETVATTGFVDFKYKFAFPGGRCFADETLVSLRDAFDIQSYTTHDRLQIMLLSVE